MLAAVGKEDPELSGGLIRLRCPVKGQKKEKKAGVWPVLARFYTFWRHSTPFYTLQDAAPVLLSVAARCLVLQEVDSFSPALYFIAASAVWVR